jgi:PAS domain S-box-containing protein
VNPALRVSLGLGLLALSGAMAVGMVAARNSAREREADLVRLATTLAHAAPREPLAALTGTPDDATTEAYAEVKGWLQRVRMTSPNVRFIYWMRADAGGHVIFLADSEPAGSDTESPPGQVFPEASDMPLLQRAFAERRALFDGFTEDRWGTWASAYAPLPGASPPILLGIDIAAGSWRAATVQHGFLAGAAALLILGAPAASWIAWNAQRRAVRARIDAADRVRRLALVVQRTHSGVIIGDADGRAVEVNESFLAMLGRTEADVIGRAWVPSTQHPDAPPESYARIFEALRTHGGCDVETLARRRDGREFWCRVEVRPLGGSDGGHVAVLTDIDASRRAEATLQVERRLLSGILAAAPVGILAFDSLEGPDGGILDFRVRLANPLASTIAGTTSGALEGRLVSDLFPGFFSSGFFRRLCETAERNQPSQMELQHHRPEGIAWLHASAVPLGRGCLVCLADITAVKRTEEKFRAIFEQSTLACALIDTLGITECNDSFLRLFRLNHVRDAVGRLPCLFNPETQPDGADSAEVYATLREQAFRCGNAVHEWVQRRADGDTFEARVSLTPVTYCGRSVLLAFWVDLSAEREARREAAVNEDRLHLAVESAEVLVWEWDATTQELHLPAGQPSLLGLNDTDIHAAVRGWEDSWRAADAAAGGTTAQSVHETEHALPPSAGGSPRWLLLRGRAAAWNASGRATRLCGTLTDITARRAAEDELRSAKDRAEEGDRAKGRFLAMMSHEIRTPMNGVIGLLELLAGTRLDPEQDDYVQTILASAGTLMAILNDVLDFSRIAAEQLRLEAVDFDVRRAFEDILALHGETAAARGLELWLDVDHGVPETLSGDVTRVRQVIGNLVANAVKFTQRGGVDITVHARPQPGGRVELHVAVHDTGIGIAPARLSQLFQPFVQADESMTRRFGGTGLGLAISRRLVEMMGGAISVESSPGNGSTFRFHVVLGAVSPVIPSTPHPALAGTTWGFASTNEAAHRAVASLLQREEASVVRVDSALPSGIDGVIVDVPATGEVRLPEAGALPLVRLQYGRNGGPGTAPKPVRTRPFVQALVNARNAAPATPAPAPSPASLGGRLVLVAEDDEACLRFAEIVLRRLGADVLGVTNGRDAVDAFAARRPMIVLLDRHMPGLDGLAAAQAMRRIEASSPSPEGSALIVALTGETGSEERQRVLAAGMDAHLVKPISMSQIEELLLPERAATR